MSLLFFFRRVRRSWLPSEFSVLPALDARFDQSQRDFALLAGGLALVLSRCSKRGAQREFAAALEAYRTIEHQMKRGHAVRIDAQLLSDLSHEIAQVADVATREAATRCLAHALREQPDSGERCVSLPLFAHS